MNINEILSGKLNKQKCDTICEISRLRSDRCVLLTYLVTRETENESAKY